MPDPVTPPVIVPAAEAQPFDPLAPRQVKPQTMEDDPDVGIRMMIAKRGEKKEAGKEDGKEGEAKPEPKPLGSLISNALKFRSSKPTEEKVEAKAEAKPEAKPESEAGTEESEVKPEAKKTAKKKVAATQATMPDVGRIASEAAVAATREAMKVTAKEKPAEQQLSPEDMRDYEVAKYLGETNPKYKGAENIIVQHVKKAERYATSWEAANPGKVFNPKDDEHTAFYDGLEKPWSDDEFVDAMVEMKASKIADQRMSKTDERLREMENKSARQGMGDVVQKTFVAAAEYLSKSLGEEVHDKIVKEGFDKLVEEDPFLGENLAMELGGLQPTIEAIVQMEDPRGIFKFDEKNQNHIAWAELLHQTEAAYAGTQDQETGKRFATREQWLAMSPAQRKSYWYVTGDHLISELVGSAAERVKANVEKEKESVKKKAAKLGFIPGTGGEAKPAKPAAEAAVTTPPKAKKEAEAKPEAFKPVSPSASAGGRIDTSGAGGTGSTGGVLQKAAGILFGR
jgi:hypothetical protein